MLLAALCLLYVPTAAVWGLAYVVGPGFAVGAGTSVSVTGTDLGAVPAFPLLAALPRSRARPGGRWCWSCRCGRRRSPGCSRAAAAPGRGRGGGRWPRCRRWPAAWSAAAVTVLSLLASGPAGPGRLAETGPTWWVTGLAAGLEVAAVMAAALLVLRRRG